MAPSDGLFQESCDEEDIFELLEAFASAPSDDVREVSASKKAQRELVMRKWNKYVASRCLIRLHAHKHTHTHTSTKARTRSARDLYTSRLISIICANKDYSRFFIEDYPKRKIDPEKIWLDLCCDDETAKKYCKVFLQWYVKKSGRWEVCLGPAEREWKREVKSAITLTEVWKCLVVEADATVLFRKRRSDRSNRRKWMLSFAEKDKTGPVAEISRVWAFHLAI